jgi:parallel beta-helix repeat protein
MLGAMLIGSTSVAADGVVPNGPAPGAEPGASAFFRINSDQELDDAASFFGWNGNGHLNHEYEIDGGLVPQDALGNYSGIYIGNTTKLFRIMNWGIYNCSSPSSDVGIYSPGAAIALYNVVGPCSIETSNLSDNPIGAWVEASSDITISSVTCRNTTGPGLLMILSSYSSLTGNQLQNNSIGISLDRSNHSFVDSNICLEDAQGISVIGSSNGTFTYNNCSSSGQGIYASDLVDSAVDNNTFDVDDYGISLSGSRNVRLGWNAAWTCQYGISSEASRNISVIHNTLTSPSIFGIRSNNTLAPHDISWNALSGTTPVGVSLSNSTSTTVRNNTVVGSTDAIVLRSASTALVRDNQVGTSQIGILAQDSPGLVMVANQLQSCSVAGLELARCNAPLLWNNTMANCDLGIWLRESCVNARVIGNEVGASGTKGIVAQSDSTGSQMTENILQGQSLAGIQVVASNNAVLSRNQANSCGIGILVQSSSGVEASNNTCLNGNRGLEFNGTSSALIKDNICRANAQAGIYLHSTSASTVLRNNCSSNLDSGMIAILGTGNKVQDNSFFGNSLSGLKAVSDSNLQLTFNRLGGNGAYGIRLDTCTNPILTGNLLTSEATGLRISGGSGALVYQNQVTKASSSGIVLSGTTVPVLHDNLVQGCTGYAIDATSTSGARIYLNVFIGNNGTASTPSPSNKQARDDSSNDDWSFSSRGNHWSDWTTPDVNRDGIVDSAYVLVGGKRSDQYPLSGPLGPITSASYKKSKTYVDLKWSAPNYTAFAPLTNYYIVRKNSTDTFTFPLLPATQTELNDTTISGSSDYTYEIRAMSSLGLSVAISIDVPRSDVVKPSVQILTPAAGSQVNSSSILASWTGTDPPPSSGIVKYEVRIDTGLWQDVGLTTSLPLAPLPQGFHTLTVRIWDGEGNNNQSGVQFYVDAYAPSLAILIPASGTIQNQSSVQVRWSATDNGTGIKGYQVRIDLGLWSDLQTLNQSSLSVPPGAHVIYVRAFDQVDLARTVSTSLIIDPYAPVVTITSPAKTDQSDRNVHLAWTGTDNLTSIVAYEVRVDETSWVPMGLQLSYDLELSEGPHTLQVRAKDQAGNYGSSQLNVTIDLTGPQVQVVRPINGVYVNQSNVMIQWNVTSTGSPLAWSEIRLDGTLPWINVSKSLTYTTPSLAEGLHLVEVRAWDQAGNSGTNSTSFIVDTLKPLVQWVYPTYGKLLNSDYLVMRWNASDDSSGLNTTYVLIDALTPLEVGLVNEYNVTNLTHGGHDIGVRVFDIAGNFREVRVYVYVDLIPPSITITYPQEGQIIQARDINVMWIASDEGTGLSHFYGKSDNSAFVDFQYTFSHVFTGFSDGRHVVYIGAVDHALNRHVTTVNFTVDFSQPVVSIQYPATGGWTNSTDFVARWTGSDSPLGMHHYEVRLDGGNWTYVGMNTTYHFSGLNLSAHVLEVKGVSNSSQETIARSTFGIDLSGPTAPTMVEPSKYANNGRISISWGASQDNQSGVAGYQVRTVRTYFNGTAYVTIIGPWVDTGTSLSYTSTQNLDGWYNVSARGKDRAGNVGPEGTVQMILDSAPPRAVDYGPLGTSVSVSAIITVSFNEPMVLSSVRVLMGASGNITWDGNTTLYFAPTSDLRYNYEYQVQVNGRDLAGNTMTSLLWEFTTRPNSGTVTGKVLNEIDAPIQGALVSLENGQTSTTNRDGMFSITAPSGNHTLTIRYEGYGDFRVNITLSAGDTTDIGSAPLSKTGTDFSWVIILTFVLLVAVAVEIVYLRKKRKH